MSIRVVGDDGSGRRREPTRRRGPAGLRSPSLNSNVSLQSKGQPGLSSAGIPPSSPRSSVSWGVAGRVVNVELEDVPCGGPSSSSSAPQRQLLFERERQRRHGEAERGGAQVAFGDSVRRHPLRRSRFSCLRSV
ncbi:hypothetical protein NL676_031078 [Syzygium grande]|nr:hypothetical protein NL676_031078 [Syzygium grande]